MADSSAVGLSHHDLLKLHCRICGLRRIDPASNRGVQLKFHPQLCRWLRYLHDIEIERESEEIYPTRACDHCIAKLRNVNVCYEQTQKRAADNVFELATRLHTEGLDDELRKLARQFTAADFWAHSSGGMCGICDDSQKDTFASEEPRGGLLIEVRQLENGPSAFSIVNFTVTKQVFVPKRDSSEVSSTSSGPSEAKVAKSAKVAKVAKSADPAAGEASSAKKAKLQPPAPPPPAVSVWAQFNNIIGRHRRQRSDRLSDVLKASVTDAPKVMSDLKASGVEYKSTTRKHLGVTSEHRTAVQKTKKLLETVPEAKRALMIFRAITDTASDGQIHILEHVGINVDLKHANMSFLLKRIKAKPNAEKNLAAYLEKKKAQEAAALPPPTPTRSMPSRGKNKDDQLLTKLPSSISISKVNKEKEAAEQEAKKPPGRRPGPKSKTQPEEKAEEEPPPPPLVLPRPEEPANVQEEASQGPLTVNEALVRKVVAEIDRRHLPANRQLRTDVIFDTLHLKQDASKLLSDHGIIYNQKMGKHHLKILSQQRKNHKKGIIKATENLNKYEWAAVMAQLIFGLVHTEDTLTLRVAGIMVDPFHEAAPMSFRMGFMLKHLLVSQQDPVLSKQLLAHILRAVDLDPMNLPDMKVVEDGLIGLLYCERAQAKSLLANTKKPIKISLNPTASAAPPTNSGRVSRPSRKWLCKDEDGLDDAADDKSIVKQEIADVDYQPRRSLTRARSAAASQPAVRGKRGKYKKSDKQAKKEASTAKVEPPKKTVRVRKAVVHPVLPKITIKAAPKGKKSKKASSLSAPALPYVLELNPEVLDPLAMPDPTIVDPMDVTIKTEVFDPMAEESLSTIIEAHDHPVISGDGPVNDSLVISSITGNLEDEDEDDGHEGDDDGVVEESPIDVTHNLIRDVDEDFVSRASHNEGSNENDEPSPPEGRLNRETVAGNSPANSKPSNESQIAAEPLRSGGVPIKVASDKGRADGDLINGGQNKEPAAPLEKQQENNDSHSQAADTIEDRCSAGPMEIVGKNNATEGLSMHEGRDKVDGSVLAAAKDATEGRPAAAEGGAQEAAGFSRNPAEADYPAFSGPLVAEGGFNAPNSGEAGQHRALSGEGQVGAAFTNFPADDNKDTDPFSSMSNGHDGDPFGPSNGADDPFGHANSSIDDLLMQNSPLGNGESAPPLLESDADELLHQLVDFQQVNHKPPNNSL